MRRRRAFGRVVVITVHPWAIEAMFQPEPGTAMMALKDSAESLEKELGCHVTALQHGTHCVYQLKRKESLVSYSIS